MYTLEVEGENTDLINYLNKQATPVAYNKYIFSTHVLASSILSKFVVFYIKRREILTMIEKKLLQKEQIYDFNAFLPTKEIDNLVHSVNDTLLDYLSQNHVFHLDGFIEFRLKEQLERLELCLQKNHELFIESSFMDGNIDFFLDMLEKEKPLEKEVFVIIENNKSILKGENTLIYVDTKENDDDILTQLMLLAPKKINIYDKEHYLSKEMVILIKQIFKEKVDFFEKEYTGNRDYQKRTK